MPTTVLVTGGPAVGAVPASSTKLTVCPHGAPSQQPWLPVSRDDELSQSLGIGARGLWSRGVGTGWREDHLALAEETSGRGHDGPQRTK